VQDAALEEHQTEVKQLEEAKAQVPLEESCHFSACGLAISWGYMQPYEGFPKMEVPQ